MIMIIIIEFLFVDPPINVLFIFTFGYRMPFCNYTIFILISIYFDYYYYSTKECYCIFRHSRLLNFLSDGMSFYPWFVKSEIYAHFLFFLSV